MGVGLTLNADFGVHRGRLGAGCGWLEGPVNKWKQERICMSQRAHLIDHDKTNNQKNIYIRFEQIRSD